MKFIITYFLLFAFTLTAQAEQSKCRVPGVTAQWELDHCFLNSETDDEENPLVSACYNLAPKSKVNEDCVRNLKLKKYRCLHLIDKNKFKGTVEECLDSKSTIGFVVKNGGVGG